MALETLDAKVAETRGRADAAHKAYANRVEDVRADGTLSEEGRRLRIADLAEATNDILDELHQSEVALVTEEFERKERAVFGSPPTDSAGLIAFRDAQERAGRLSNEGEGRSLASDYLKQAKLSGDRQLAAAVLSKAMSLGWSDVADTYRATYPEDASKLDEMATIRHFVHDTQAKFMRAMVYGHVSTY